MKLYLFDLDGTLINSRALAFEAINAYTAKKGIRIEEKIIKEFDWTILAKGAHLTPQEIPRVVQHMRSYMEKHISKTRLVPGIPQVLEAALKTGKLVVLTSNSKTYAEKAIKKHGLKNITEIHAGSPLFGKAHKIREVIKKHHARLEDTIVIGDEVRDIEAGNHVGVQTIAVGWGFSTVPTLTHAKPTHIFKQPKELIKFLTNA